MSIKQSLESALKDALRAGDDLRKNTLRLALSAIRLAEVEGGAALEDGAILTILQKEIKARHESIADAQKAGRSDLVTAAQKEIGVLETFLPKQLTPAELEDMARQAIVETGAVSLREMGAVMKLLIPRLQGRAAGDQASQVVRRLLSQ